MSRTASSRTAASGLDNAKCATVVLNVRLKPLFVPILVRLSAGADPASFSDSGSIKIEGIALGRLDDKDLLIVVAEIEPVFQERREDRADARMTALAQPFDNACLVGVRRLPQLAERRQETCVVWRLGVYRDRRPKGRAAARTATARPHGRCFITCSSVPNTSW